MNETDMNTTPVLECRGLTKTFAEATLNVEVLKGVDLAVGKGEQVAAFSYSHQSFFPSSNCVTFFASVFYEKLS